MITGSTKQGEGDRPGHDYRVSHANAASSRRPIYICHSRGPDHYDSCDLDICMQY